MRIFTISALFSGVILLGLPFKASLANQAELPAWEQSDRGGSASLAWQDDSWLDGAGFGQQREQRRQPQQERRQPQSQRGGLDFDFSHISAWVGSEELEESGQEADAWRFEAAFQGGGSSYLFLNWQQADYEELGDRTTREFGLGIQEHYTDRAAFFLTAGYLQDRWDAALLERDAANMLRGRYGIRFRPTDRIELDGAVVYTRGSGSTDMDAKWSMDVGLSIYVTESIAIRAAALDLDGIHPSNMVGLRVEFGGF